jgi:hypothetical protein
LLLIICDSFVDAHCYFTGQPRRKNVKPGPNSPETYRIARFRATAMTLATFVDA